jgi:predicted nucleic acid-binding protein
VIVVSNTSPLIVLAKIHRLDLLRVLHAQILIPEAVLEEVRAKPGPETDEVQSSVGRFLVTMPVNSKIMKVVPDTLGIGERSAIARALSLQADLIILDDQEARGIATDRGLKVTGTLGILVEAHSRGIIQSLRSELDRLIEAGMWINEAFYHRLLSEFQE